MFEIFDIMAYEFPAVLCDPESFEVIAYNAAAEMVFHLGKSKAPETSYELYTLAGEDLLWYRSIPTQAGQYDFRPVKSLCNLSDIVLDSIIVENDATIRRLDIISPIGTQSGPAYYSTLELASNGQRWDRLKGQDIDGDVAEILRAVVFTYAADRAYIVELDTNINCLVDVYTYSRTGFCDSIAGVRLIEGENINIFVDMWESGTSLSDENYKKSDYIGTKLYSQLYSSMENWAYMIVPFRKRSGIRCFLCVDNIRRFFDKKMLLRNYALMLENCMYSAKLYESMQVARNLVSELSHIPENTLKIYFFGGLKITTNKGLQEEVSAFSAQCGTFFVYLLSNRNRLVPIRKLADVLWPEELIDNPYNMIKNIAFRTRKVFENVCDKPVIIAGSGTYFINPELKLWLDIEEFEKLCKKAFDTNIAKDSRLNACKKAFNLYTGAMLPNFDNEPWLMTRICYYQILYCELVRVYINFLNEENDYTAMFRIVAQAMERERLDGDIYLVLMKALLRNGRRDLVKNYYGKIKTQLTREEDAQFRSMWSE